MLDTIATRMGLDYFEAEVVAKDCVRRGGAQLEMESVRLEDAGRTMRRRAARSRG